MINLKIKTDSRFNLMMDNDGKYLVRKINMQNSTISKNVVFRIDVLFDNFLEEKKKYLESDKIIEKEKQFANEKIVIYEWENNIGFVKKIN